MKELNIHEQPFPNHNNDRGKGHVTTASSTEWENDQQDFPSYHNHPLYLATSIRDVDLTTDDWSRVLVEYHFFISPWDKIPRQPIQMFGVGGN